MPAALDEGFFGILGFVEVVWPADCVEAPGGTMPGERILVRSFGVLLGLGIAGFFILRRTLKLGERKDKGAFIEYFDLLPAPPPAPPSAPHPLSGLTFAVKDM
jgi:hypothetical protein